MASAPPPPVALGARCAQHPEAPAVAPCTRCGTFLCPECTEVLEEGAYCGACVAWLRREGPPSRAVQWCIALGVLGLVAWPLCLVGALFSLLAATFGLGRSALELRRIRRGEAPLRGRPQARLALVLACLNLALLLLFGGVVALAWRG